MVAILTSKYTKMLCGQAPSRNPLGSLVLPIPPSWTWLPLLGGEGKRMIRKRRGGKKGEESGIGVGGLGICPLEMRLPPGIVWLRACTCRMWPACLYASVADKRLLVYESGRVCMLTAGWDEVWRSLVDDEIDKVTWWDEAAERAVRHCAYHRDVLYAQNHSSPYKL